MDLIKAIAALPNGDVLNIIQAASEYPEDVFGTEERLEMGYEEVKGHCVPETV